MTGQHGRRGSGRRDHGSHRPGHGLETGTPGAEAGRRAAAEVEDIETRGLARSNGPSGPPLGVQGVVAAVALVALLAVGFGALGGRTASDATPDPSIAAAGGAVDAPAESTGSPPTTGPNPLVTPWMACSPTTGDVPVVYLEVDGRRSELDTEVTWRVDSPDVSPRRPGGRGQAAVVVPSDVHTELWIEGGACASAWTITGNGRDLGSVINVALDPEVAAQNRFELRLSPFSGQEVALRARLIFPDLILDLAQAIRVEPYAHPVALLYADEGVRAVEGCDVIVTLANGYETERSCTGDLPFPPDDVLVVDAGARISFRIPGWIFMGVTATCGHLSELEFVAEPEPGCFAELGVDPSLPGVGFTPDFVGRWTLAVSACALDAGRPANRVCGDWYADVRVEG